MRQSRVTTVSDAKLIDSSDGTSLDIPLPSSLEVRAAVSDIKKPSRGGDVLALLPINLDWPTVPPLCQQAEAIDQSIDLLTDRSRLVWTKNKSV